MMRSWGATWIIGGGALTYAFERDPTFHLQAWMLFGAMILLTFMLMYLVAKAEMGRSYARRNLLLGISLTLISGVGFALWPPLVNSEIAKFERCKTKS